MKPVAATSAVATAGARRKGQRRIGGKRKRWDRWSLLQLPMLAAVIGLWQLILVVFSINKALIPAPFDVAFALWDGLSDKSYYSDIWQTLREVILGFGIGSAVGALLGVLVGEFRTAERLLSPYVVALQAVPKVAIAPLFAVVLGYGELSKLVIVALIAFFPVFVNSVAGLKASPPDQLELMRVYGASRLQTLRLVKLKNAMTFVFAGLNIAVTLSVIGAIVAEFVGAQSGLGAAILKDGNRLDSARVFASITILAVMTGVLSWLVQLAGKRAVFWANQQSN